jgi:hypothetical protein
MITVNVTFSDLNSGEGWFEIKNLDLTFDKLLHKLSGFATVDNPSTVSSETCQIAQSGVTYVRSMHLVSETVDGLWNSAVNLTFGGRQ